MFLYILLDTIYQNIFLFDFIFGGRRKKNVKGVGCLLYEILWKIPSLWNSVICANPIH